METEPTRARPGRKRSEETRVAILRACFELFGEIGYSALTIEGIAARAGCGKQTIYRWWPAKADVLLDALATKADIHVPLDDHGSYAADLSAFLRDSFTLARRHNATNMLRALMAEAQVDADFGERFRTRFLNRRREALGAIVARAGQRGDLPAHPAPAVVLDVVFGVLWYRVLATHTPLNEALVGELVQLLTGAPPPAVEPARRTRRRG